MSCALTVFKSEIFVEQCLVSHTLELLWTEIVELRRFQPKQVNLSSLGEPYREGKDSCRVFILYMHILYLHGLVLLAKWLTRGMIIFADG